VKQLGENIPAAIDVVDPIYDGRSILLIQLYATSILEEVLMHVSSRAPGHKLVYTTGAVPVVGQ